jgi:hypothetical protein
MFKYPHRDYNPSERSSAECVSEWPESLVSPDTSLTIREIVDNFTRGIPTTAKVYESSSTEATDVDQGLGIDFLNFDSLDLAEITELQSRLSARTAYLKSNQVKKVESSSNSTETNAANSESDKPLN